MNRLAAGLGVLVGALGIVCIALIIVVAVQSPPQQITQVNNNTFIPKHFMDFQNFVCLCPSMKRE